jgi:hypothetical protein
MILSIFLVDNSNAQSQPDEFSRWNFSGHLSYSHTLDGATSTFNTGQGVLTERFDTDNNHIFSIDGYGLFEYSLLKERLNIGLGTGYFQSINPEFGMAPVFVSIKLLVMQNHEAYYLFGHIGQSFRLANMINAGSYLRLGGGYQFRLKNQNFSIEAGINARKAEYDGSSSLTNAIKVVRATGVHITAGYHLPLKKK